MSKAILHKLKKMSMDLPPSFRYELRRDTGANILARNPKAQIDGKPLDPKQHYQVKVATPVNHYRTMKKLFAEKGIQQVEEYVKSIFDKTQLSHDTGAIH